MDSQQICPDVFPEVAYFEDPNQKGKSSDKHKDYANHPVLKEISIINGSINKLTVKALKAKLRSLKLDCRGSKEVLRKRLKNHDRRSIFSNAGMDDPNLPKQYYTHLLVIDFEATCEEQQTKTFVHEIIEFPAVLIDISRCEVVAEFHSYIRPIINPQLSEFCTKLTGIQQETIDQSATFPSILSQFEDWLQTQGIRTPNSESQENKFAVVTDGPWDMARFLLTQCNISSLPFPSWARSWINLRKIFSNFYITKRLCLSDMLKTLGLEFKGRPHCGLDDARNIAAIVERLLQDGSVPRVNETINNLPTSLPPSIKSSNVSTVTLKEFESSERRRNRSRRKKLESSAENVLDSSGKSSASFSSSTSQSTDADEKETPSTNIICEVEDRTHVDHRTHAEDRTQVVNPMSNLSISSAEYQPFYNIEYCENGMPSYKLNSFTNRSSSNNNSNSNSNQSDNLNAKVAVKESVDVQKSKVSVALNISDALQFPSLSFRK